MIGFCLSEGDILIDKESKEEYYNTKMPNKKLLKIQNFININKNLSVGKLMDYNNGLLTI